MLDLPFDMAGVDDLLDMPPNQLRICLMRARELPVMDVAEGLASGSSDPFATLFVESINKDDMKDKPQVLRSSTKVQSLRPVWMERFDVPVDDAGAISASRGAAAPSRHRCDSCPSHDEVGGFFFEFEAIRTEASDRDAPRRRDCSSCTRTRSSASRLVIEDIK